MAVGATFGIRYAGSVKDDGDNVLVTVERYASLAAWDEYNATATRYPALVSAVFDGIYPTTLTPYDTEILRAVDLSEVK